MVSADEGGDSQVTPGGARIPLRRYIFARVLLNTTLLLIALGVILGLHHTLESREFLLSRMATRSFVISESIDTYIDEHRRAILMLARLLGEMKDPEGDHLAASMKSFHDSYPSFITVLAADRSGTVIAADPLPEGDPHHVLGSNIADRAYFTEALRTGRPFRSYAFRGRGFGNDPIVALSAPVLSSAETSAPAVVEGSLNLARFREFERYLAGLEKGSLVITDSSLNVVYSSTPEFKVLSSLNDHKDLGEPAPAPTVSSYRNERGMRFYVAHAITSNGWHVMILQPVSVLFGHIGRQTLFTALWVCVAAGAMLILSRRIARRVTLPLEGLVDAVRDVQTGTEHVKIPAPDSSVPLEIRKLFDDFKLMTERLGISRLQLETANRDLAETLDLAQAGSRTKTAFLAKMSHELRTPLNAIIGFSGILSSRLSDDAKLAELAGNILSAGKEMLRLVEQLLEIALVESGALHIQPATVDAASVFGQIFQSASSSPDGAGARLTSAVPSELGEIVVDRERLERMIASFLSGIRRLPGISGIHVDVAREERDGADWIVARFQLGGDIDRARVASTLEPFWEDETPGPRRFGEAGLGIAIAHRYCELMGGDMTVRAGSGEATVIVVRIPTAYEVPEQE